MARFLGGTRNDIWVEGEDHPHPNLPPLKGEGGEGRVVLCFLGTVVDFASDSQ